MAYWGGGEVGITPKTFNTILLPCVGFVYSPLPSPPPLKPQLEFSRRHRAPPTPYPIWKQIVHREYLWQALIQVLVAVRSLQATTLCTSINNMQR